MKYDVLRQEVDMAGNLRVWVDLGDGSCHIFKFAKQPDKTQILQLVDNLVAAREQDLDVQIATLDAQIADLTTQKQSLLAAKQTKVEPKLDI